MKGLELKKFNFFIWRGSNADEKSEKTPFAKEKPPVMDNGAISKLVLKKDIDSSTKEMIDKSDEFKEGGMSWQRKSCFVMSFNVWVLYFLVLAWLIPCKNRLCFVDKEKWKIVYSNASLATNLAVFSKAGLPPLALYGYENDYGANLAAVSIEDGQVSWNISMMNLNLRHVKCNFDPFKLDVDEDGIPDCLVYGSKTIIAINASNGFIFWQQHFESGIVKYAIVSPLDSLKQEQRILVLWSPKSRQDVLDPEIEFQDHLIVVLDTRNGKKFSKMYTPCIDWSHSVKLVPWYRPEKDATKWYLVCNFDGNAAAEVWTFPGKLLIEAAFAEEGKSANFSSFQQLYSSLDDSERELPYGVKMERLEKGIILAWENAIQLVSREKSWTKRFVEAHKSPIDVTNLAIGHFSTIAGVGNESTRGIQIAVGVKQNSSTTIHVLEPANGSIIASKTLVKANQIGMRTLRDDVSSTDLLLIEKVRDYTISSSNHYDKRDSSNRTFYLLHLVEKSPKLELHELFHTSGVYDSIIVSNSKDNTYDLILVRESSKGGLNVNKYAIPKEAIKGKICPSS